jgi:hypothetical protein
LLAIAKGNNNNNKKKGRIQEKSFLILCRGEIEGAI